MLGRTMNTEEKLLLSRLLFAYKRLLEAHIATQAITADPRLNFNDQIIASREELEDHFEAAAEATRGAASLNEIDSLISYVSLRLKFQELDRGDD